MGKTGGQGKGKPKMKDKNFGKALMKSHAVNMDDGIVSSKGKLMNSILESNHLTEYVESNEISNKQHDVIRAPASELLVVEATTIANVQKMDTSEFSFTHLKIPRKPAWNHQMTAEDVDLNEKDAFMTWRREIAALEEASSHLRVTPFEKNLEVWRQLWRVMERCDLTMQIVDARNPLLYYTNDLVKYASEHNPAKPMLLLINKADYLTDYQRNMWSRELEKMGIKFAFYSAVTEQKRIDEDATREARRMEYDLAQMHITAEPMNVGSVRETVNTTSRLDQMKSVLALDEDSDDENTSADTNATEVEVAQASTVENASRNIIREQDFEEDYEEEEEEEEKVVSNPYEDVDDTCYCDDKAVSDLANDLVLNYIDTIAKFEESKKVPKKKSSKKKNSISAIAASTVYVWGDGSETTVGAKASTTTTGAGKMLSNESSSATMSTGEYDALIERRCRVLTREELILLMTMLPKKLEILAQARHQHRACIGLVGYPNVGKSSVINTILGVSKSSHGHLRVAVSSTPGKTKHFQTLNINENLMLCDCPGLVFPSFMRSTGEMLCAGVLPINSMRDHVDPASVIASRVPLHLLDAAYGMHIIRKLDIKDDPNRPPTGHEVLHAYCEVKTYITTGTGNWDEFRACKEILRDFNDGKILFVASPPSLSKSGDAEALDQWLLETESVMMRKSRVAERIVAQKQKEEDAALEEHDEENVSDSDSEDEEPPMDAAGNILSGNRIPGREHKRAKRWGKKQRKLRDPNPYSEENGTIAYVAHTTNRVVVGGHKAERNKRNNPRMGSYGSEYVNRAIYPHHASVQHALHGENK